MSIYAIADLHLSFSTGKSKEMDIFSGWKDYAIKIKNNWSKTVSSNDTVVIAGDLSWAMKLEETFMDFKFLENLPGKKILIKGNHDYWWGSKTKILNYLKENSFSTVSILYNNAFNVENIAICGTRGWFLDPKEECDIKVLNREVGRLEKSLQIGRNMGLEPIVFLHYPPVYDDFECKEIMNILIKNNIKKCYYGHIHGRVASQKAKVGLYKGIDFKLIACDQVNFTPVFVC